MKFLFDQSADFRLIPHLRQLGYDVHVISRNYPPGLPDEDVLEIARKERRVLIVADRDFGELIFQRGLAHAGVIFFRLPGAKLQTKIDQLNTVLAEHTDDLERGEFLVVAPGPYPYRRSSTCLEPFLEARRRLFHQSHRL
jgi:predicted nuclease of predicted toxin-antitoxin system